MRAALMECCSPSTVDWLEQSQPFEAAVWAATEDLMAFAQKDPAARGEAKAIAYGYLSYKAVLHYRLARAISGMLDGQRGMPAELDAAVLLVSARGRMLSGAEIHPRSMIGHRLVLDHGYGTVIGETTQIGDDCYILGGVVLGATGISANPAGKRHPTLGNRVEVGAFARIFGNVTVGDDVLIGPHCVIKDDVSAGSVVTVRSVLQVTRGRALDSKSRAAII
ncbi:serine O-acetyltransferase [Burkholderia cepacia]|uniref:serine O-acetyltransferase n=1 Tax=Burkholderia cepacia TaxID=292 RepID=A0AAQ0JJT0_BURCE|nr:serine O-acetyltransferase [Burkholderia cepacia]MCE4128400.1 serine O-acetyltransferase [Burkholderia cepacia]MDN7856408.1 serine O-acetyltransferase [Burkholderia cepacia]QFS36954.1 Bacterial transferase hexapeptide (six repeats) [Burkholderia cepacia]RAQ10261.1 serine acetyltransferase [Burkholderia cepacia]